MRLSLVIMSSTSTIMNKSELSYRLAVLVNHVKVHRCEDENLNYLLSKMVIAFLEDVRLLTFVHLNELTNGKELLADLQDDVEYLVSYRKDNFKSYDGKLEYFIDVYWLNDDIYHDLLVELDTILNLERKIQKKKNLQHKVKDLYPSSLGNIFIYVDTDSQHVVNRIVGEVGGKVLRSGKKY